MICVWRKPHEAMDVACQQGTIEVGSGSIMVWGWFNRHSMGSLVRLQTSLTGATIGPLSKALNSQLLKLYSLIIISCFERIVFWTKTALPLAP
uniref:Uncharacterized protein n=1 Tax=Electrophorus electricus TaxID=8005 RepID=A0A4W4EIZ2_ELEEL